MEKKAVKLAAAEMLNKGNLIRVLKVPFHFFGKLKYEIRIKVFIFVYILN